MSVFMTGATGFIGRAVLTRLIEEKFDVLALVETPEEQRAVEAAGGTTYLGDEDDTEELSSLILDSDGVIHLATSPDRDEEFIDAAIRGLESSTKPFVYTGNIWTYGHNLEISESSDLNPPPATRWLAKSQERLMQTEGVRVSVIVPAIVYGHGQGIPRSFTDARDTSGHDAFLPLAGDGSQHWATVHVDDLADLYARAVSVEGHNNEVYIAADRETPTVLEIGTAAAKAAGLPGGARAQSLGETQGRWGPGLAELLLLDQKANSDKARHQLGWTTSRPTLLDELEVGYTTDPRDPLWN